MVLKKRKSKRQTPKTRHNLHKRVKATIIKQKKLDAKQRQPKVKVPVNVLRTEEEILHLKNIKAREDMNKTKIDLPLKDDMLQQMIDYADILIHILDARSLEIGKLPTDKPVIYVVKRLEMVPDHVKENIKDIYIWNNNNDQFIEYLKQFKIKENTIFGVVGQKNVGKSSFIHAFRGFSVIKQRIDLLDINHGLFITNQGADILSCETTLSNVVRNAIDLSTINVEYFCLEMFKQIELIGVGHIYGVVDFQDGKDLLKQIAKKNGQKVAETARRILLDVACGKISYFSFEGKDMFSIYSN